MAEGERDICEQRERQLREVRSWTKKLTDRVPDAWLDRRVEWTDNTIGWHMGHLAQQQDSDAYHCFGADRMLDAEWDRLFGFGCEVYPADAYPSPERLRRVFDTALKRFLEHLSQIEEDRGLLARPFNPPEWTPPGWTILNCVANIIYHEGEHSNGIGTLLSSFEK